VTLGENVRELRRNAGWQRVDLANKSGLGMNTLFRIEYDKTKPRRLTLQLLAKAFGITVAELLQGQGSVVSYRHNKWRKIGRQVKTLRERKGLTQSELAELSGIADATIVGIEKDRHKPRQATIAGLAKALDVPYWLISPEHAGPDRRFKFEPRKRRQVEIPDRLPLPLSEDSLREVATDIIRNRKLYPFRMLIEIVELNVKYVDQRSREQDGAMRVLSDLIYMYHHVHWPSMSPEEGYQCARRIAGLLVIIYAAARPKQP
jgi:transcriptional regulator with XRE-family HTH domain